VCALLFGLALRLFFVFRLPSTAGDTPLYESLAGNWIRHRIYGIDVDGTLTPLDIRMPGYPAYLALVQLLAGRGAEASRFWVMLGQVFIDLAACLVIAALAARLSGRREGSSRAFTAALWLSALCPFLANYVAVPLTEPFAILLTALALTSFVALVMPQYPTRDFLEWAKFPRRSDFFKNAAFAGLCVGAGTLFRPEAPLVLIACVPVVLVAMIRRGQGGRGLRAAGLAIAGMLLVLLPWTVRNALTLHEIQPLTPQYTTMPGELVPSGFMAWERTWLYRFREVYLVPWKLNDEAIQADDIPARAFDSHEERQHVAAILEQYNSDLKLTAEEDAQFGAIARERTARHPWRTWVTVPLQRAVTLWFTPRIEQLPVSGNVFPLSETWESDRADMSTTAGFFLVNLFYLALALAGVWRVWRNSADARLAVLMLSAFVLLRTAFLTTVETPEPRYVLVCFPVIFAFAAQSFVRRDTVAS
jgi:hypothetical protein